MSHRKLSQGKMPTKPISFDATENIDIVPPVGQQTAHLSGTFGTFIENKADTRFFPLIMSGFGPSEVRCLRTRKLRLKPIFKGYLYETIERPKLRHLAPNQSPQLY
jgi:hypothetical protein